MISLVVIASGAGVIAWLGWNGRRDRAPVRTIDMALAAGLLMAVPVAAYGNSGTATYVWLVLVVGMAVLARSVAAWRGYRERTRSHALALSAGLDLASADALYGRPGRTPLDVLVPYLLATLSWVLAIIATARAAATSLFDHPALDVALGGDEPLLMPWWVLVALGIQIVAVIHWIVRSRGDIRTARRRRATVETHILR